MWRNCTAAVDITVHTSAFTYHTYTVCNYVNVQYAGYMSDSGNKHGKFLMHSSIQYDNPLPTKPACLNKREAKWYV